MRTTIDLDDDVLSAVRSLAHAEERSLGAVLSDLVRRALRIPSAIETGIGGFPVFDVPEGRPITSEAVRIALDDES